MKGIKLNWIVGSFLLMHCFLAYQQLYAQTNFINLIKGNHDSQALSIKGLADKGFVVLALDSGKIFRFTSCGALLWSKVLQFNGDISPNSFVDVVTTKNGNLMILIRKMVGSKFFPGLISINTNGEILFSKYYSDPFYTHYPYTVTEGLDGNFTIFGNAVYESKNVLYLRLQKINPLGEEIWTQFYDHAGVWGSAISTSDTGNLIRTGPYFIKVAPQGNISWARKQTSANSYYYYSAIEVDDGYIFSGSKDQNRNVILFKMNKEGFSDFGFFKEFKYKGRPLPLVQKKNGGFLTAFNPNENANGEPVMVEFDKNLQILKSKAIRLDELPYQFDIRNLDILVDGSTYFTGNLDTKNQLVPRQIFYGKTDSSMQLACLADLDVVDSSFLFSFEYEPFGTVPYYNTPVNFQVESISLNRKWESVCGSWEKTEINLGPDVLICKDSSLTLIDKKVRPDEIKIWSNGQTLDSILVNQPGAYWLQSINSCRLDTVADTIQIGLVKLPDFELSLEKEICNGNSILLKVPIGSALYQWQDGSTDSSYLAYKGGKYKVDIKKSGCPFEKTTELLECKPPEEIPEKEKPELEMPSLFTPNSDTKNDKFLPTRFKGIIRTEMEIYNRWGKKVFDTEDIVKNPWKGDNSENGLYFWVLKYVTVESDSKTMSDWIYLQKDK